MYSIKKPVKSSCRNAYVRNTKLFLILWNKFRYINMIASYQSLLNLKWSVCATSSRTLPSALQKECEYKCATRSDQLLADSVPSKFKKGILLSAGQWKVSGCKRPCSRILR